MIYPKIARQRVIKRPRKRTSAVRLVIQNRQAKRSVSPDVIRLFWLAAKICAASFPALWNKHSEISLLICDDSFIARLNGEYLGKNTATDVLSFPQFLSLKDIGEVSGTAVLGDIVISAEQTRKQAQVLGHSFDREAAFLFVHGLLHLLGFDHIKAQDESQMLTAQRLLMKKLSIYLCKAESVHEI